MNKINKNFFSNVSFEKKIFICNKTLLKRMFDEFFINEKDEDLNLFNFTLKYIENLDLNHDLTIHS